MKIRTLCFTTAFAAFSTHTALANDSSESAKIDEVIVISSRIEQPLRDVGTSVSVLTRDDIASSGVTTLGDALRTLPGVSLSNTGGVGKQTSVRIRGEEAYRTLVLIDGLDVTDVSTPQAIPSVEHIPLRGIGRVEVLRGPQGMMYGADAGGVVNISTRAVDEDFALGVTAEAGRYGTRQQHLETGAKLGVADFYLSASTYDTDGFNARIDDSVIADEDGYDNSTYHGRFGLALTNEWRLDAVARDTRATNQYDNCFVVSQNCVSDFDLESYLVKAQGDYEHYSHTVSAQQNDSERRYYSDDQYQFYFESRLEKFSYLGAARWTNELGFVYGAERKQESFGGTYNELQVRTQTGYFLEYQGKFAQQLSLTAGGRYDDNDQYGSHGTYRVSAAWLLGLNKLDVKFKSSVSTGFRAPSMYEVQHNGSPWASLAAQQTELKEEESQGFDVGTEVYFTNGAVVELVYFMQRVDDQIFFSSGYLQEDGRSRSKGVELNGSTQVWDWLELGANYTYNDAKAVDGSERVLRPRHVANINVDSVFFDGQLKANVNLRYSGEQTDVDRATEIDQYGVANLSLRYAPIEVLELFARIENLFDRDYIEVKNYYTSGRAGYVGLNLHF